MMRQKNLVICLSVGLVSVGAILVSVSYYSGHEAAMPPETQRGNESASNMLVSKEVRTVSDVADFAKDIFIVRIVDILDVRKDSEYGRIKTHYRARVLDTFMGSASGEIELVVTGGMLNSQWEERAGDVVIIHSGTAPSEVTDRLPKVGETFTIVGARNEKQGWYSVFSLPFSLIRIDVKETASDEAAISAARINEEVRSIVQELDKRSRIR